MTQKELLYYEDAIGHVKNIVTILEDCKERINDKKLEEFISNQIEIQTTMQKNLTNLLEVKVNE